jgi:hypothetical protein
VPSASLAVLRVPLSRGEESVMNQVTTLGKDRIDRELAEAGLETNGTFAEHLTIGNSGDLCVLVHRSTWETDEPAYELYDVDKHVSYWIHEIPTPERAAALLKEHGETPEEE